MVTKNSYLSQRVRAARGKESLRDFSKKCGISHAFLRSIETGISNRGKPLNITIYTLAKLVNSGVEIDYGLLIEACLHEDKSFVIAGSDPQSPD